MGLSVFKFVASVSMAATVALLLDRPSIGNQPSPSSFGDPIGGGEFLHHGGVCCSVPAEGRGSLMF